MQGSTPTEVIDFEEALNNVGGSLDLLGELAEALKSELPRLLKGVRDGVESDDADAVSRASHSIKGSVTPFAAKKAYDAAWSLEEPSANGDLANAGDKLNLLERELTKLTAALDGAFIK